MQSGGSFNWGNSPKFRNCVCICSAWPQSLSTHWYPLTAINPQPQKSDQQTHLQSSEFSARLHVDKLVKWLNAGFLGLTHSPPFFLIPEAHLVFICVHSVVLTRRYWEKGSMDGSKFYWKGKFSSNAWWLIPTKQADSSRLRISWTLWLKHKGNLRCITGPRRHYSGVFSCSPGAMPCFFKVQRAHA